MKIILITAICLALIPALIFAELPELKVMRVELVPKGKEISFEIKNPNQSALIIKTTLNRLEHVCDDLIRRDYLSKGKETILYLRPGEVSIVFTAEGYYPLRESISLQKGEFRQVWVDRVRPEPVGEYKVDKDLCGKIEITSDPEGASLFMNDFDTGLITPLKISNVPASKYDVVLKLDGFDDKTFHCDLSPDKIWERDVDYYQPKRSRGTGRSTIDIIHPPIDDYMDRVFPPANMRRQPELIGGTSSLTNYIDKHNLHPKTAKDLRVSGIALVGFTVGIDGIPKDIQVIQESPADLGFGQAGVEVMKAMRFEPAMRNGKPVEVTMQQPVKFSLK